MQKLQTNVEKGLWFAKTFGLDIQSATFKDDLGGNHTLSYTENVRKSYKDLPEAEKPKVKNVLFNLDKFYHELSMVHGNEYLPRLYIIRQCKDELNKQCVVSRTPCPVHGAQLDFLAELESVIENEVCFVLYFVFS